MKWTLLLLTAVSMSVAQAKSDKSPDQILAEALAAATDKIDCSNGQSCAPSVSNLKCGRVLNRFTCDFTDSSGKSQHVVGAKAAALFEAFRSHPQLATYCKMNDDCSKKVDIGEISCENLRETSESAAKASCRVKLKLDSQSKGQPVQLITPEEAAGGGSGAGAH